MPLLVPKCYSKYFQSWGALSISMENYCSSVYIAHRVSVIINEYKNTNPVVSLSAFAPWNVILNSCKSKWVLNIFMRIYSCLTQSSQCKCHSKWKTPKCQYFLHCVTIILHNNWEKSYNKCFPQQHYQEHICQEYYWSANKVAWDNATEIGICQQWNLLQSDISLYVGHTWMKLTLKVPVTAIDALWHFETG